MTKRIFAPAIDGTQERLDAIIDGIDHLCDLLTPASKPEPKAGETVELREPKTPPATHPGAPLSGPTQSSSAKLKPLTGKSKRK